MNRFQEVYDKCMDSITRYRYDEAVSYAHELLDIYESDTGKYEVHNVFKNIEKVYYNTPNAIQYVTYMQRLIDIFESEERYEEMARTMYFLGIDYIAVKNLDGAEIILNQAMNIAKKISAFDVQADIINGFGNLYEIKNENQNALEYYLIAFNMASEHNYYEGKRFAHNVGYAYKKLGKYSRAIHYLKLCLEFLTTVDMPGRLGNTWNELGATYTLNKDYALAHDALDKGYLNSEESKSNAFLKENLMFQSNLYELEHNFEKAFYYHKRLFDMTQLINVDRHNKDLVNLNFQSEVSSIELENEIIKQKNQELEAYSKALDKSNKSLIKSIAETKLMQKKMIQSEKNASYNRMMIGVAHKVNTSIANINLMTALIQREIGEFNTKLSEQSISKDDISRCIDSTCDSLELIHSSSDKVAKFIESVKNVSISLSEMNMSGTFAELLNDCINENELGISRFNCKVSLWLQEDLPTISGYNIFKRIINQFFDNTFKYAFRDEINNTIDIRVYFNKKGKIVIAFKDNGLGIDKEDCQQIFDPFFTSNMGLQGGAGMGLYIVQKTVTEILSGEVTCVSKDHSGAEFFIELPNQFISL